MARERLPDDNKAGERVRCLVRVYPDWDFDDGEGFFVPEIESTLLSEIAGRFAGLMNRCNLGITTFDGLEALDYRDIGGGNRFMEEFLKRLDHPVVFDER